MKTTIVTYRHVLFDWVDSCYRMAPDQSPLGPFAGIEYVDPVDASRVLRDISATLHIDPSRIGVHAVDHPVVVGAVTFETVTEGSLNKYVLVVQEGDSIFTVLVEAGPNTKRAISALHLPPWLALEDVLKVQRFRDAVSTARLEAMTE